MNKACEEAERKRKAAQVPGERRAKKKQQNQKKQEQRIPVIPEREAKGPHEEIPEGMKVLSEGMANVLYSAANQTQVFYNPAMETNRDISIAMVNVYIDIIKEEEATKKRTFKEDHLPDDKRKGIRILEALSATGLRSIRYARELPASAVHSIIANDLDAAAVASISRNVEFNKLSTSVQSNEGETQTTPPPVLPNHANANTCMYEASKNRFNVVDIDPYGAPNIFLNAAIQSISEGGLLCVTATDMPVLCGKYPETCYAKYGATSVKGPNCHEVALRVLLGCIERHATQYKRMIVPVVSLSVDYYVRVFVRVYTSASEVKKSASKMGYVLQCSTCSSHDILPMMKLVETEGKRGGTSLRYKLGSIPADGSTCKHCQSNCIQVTGPIWIEPTFDPTVLKMLMDHLTAKKDSYNSYSRLFGLLTAMSSEILSPLVYSVPKLSSLMHASTPPIASFKSAFLNANYKVTSSHTDPSCIKTDAPNEFLWDVFRAWVKLNPIKTPSETSPAAKILSIESTHTIDFTISEGRESEIGSAKLKRKHGKDSFVPTFLPPPTSHWGPKARATGFKRKPTEEDGMEVENVAKKQKVTE